MKTVTQAYKNEMAQALRKQSHLQISITAGSQTYTFNDSDIISAKKVQEADPLSRKLPTETFNFTVSDFAGLYNPASPSGIWETIDENAEISVRFGLTVGNSIEWLSADKYVLTGRPSAKSCMASFSAISKLSRLDVTYYKGTLAVRDLKSLAERVLEDAGIDSSEYYISDSLSSIATRAAIPITSHKNALQMIAHAAGYCLRTVNGKITISYADLSEAISSLNPTLDLSDIAVGGDAVTKIEPLYKVQAKRYIYRAAEESTVIYESEVEVNGHIPFHAEFDEAQNLTATIETLSGSTGAITDTHFYAYAADFTVIGNGTYKITISGKLVSAYSTVSETVFGDPGGGIDIIDNPLISTAAMQRRVIVYSGDYLVNRVTHTLQTRGNPEIESMDGLNFVPAYKTEASGIVLGNTIDFNGAVKGTMIVKSILEIARGDLYALR